jgi:hypothetical protein
MKIVIGIIFFLFAFAVTATPPVIDRYVDTDVSGGLGDGTSWTNAIATDSAAMDTLSQNLTDDGGNIMHIHCRGTKKDSIPFAFNNDWTTSDTCYVMIINDSLNHPRIYTDKSGISITQEHLWLKNITIKVQGVTALQACIVAQDTVNIEGCRFETNGTSTVACQAVRVQSPALVRIWNTETTSPNEATYVSFDNAGVAVTSGICIIYSSIIIGGWFGVFNDAGTLTMKNTYGHFSRSEGGYGFYGTRTMTTCAASDTTGSSDGLRNIAYSISSGAKFTSITEGSEDFHLLSGSNLIDSGTSTHSDAAPFNFTTDKDGVSHGTTQEIGPYEYGSEESCDDPLWHDTTFAPCTVGVTFEFTGKCDSCDSVAPIGTLPDHISLNHTTFVFDDSLVDIQRDSIPLIAYNCDGDSVDTGYAIIDVILDSIKQDSVTCGGVKVDGDTVYANDTLINHGWYGNRTKDSLKINDTIVTTVSSNDTQIVYVPGSNVPVGWFTPYVEDQYSADSSDSIYFGGIYDTATITLDPHDTTVSDGQTVIFHITATSTRAITYKWQVNDGGGYDDVASSDNDTLTWAAATAEDGYLYRCIATDPRGADTSTAATLNIAAVIRTLTVTDAGNGSTTPSGPTAVEGGVATNITATSDAHYGFVRWTRSTTDIAIADTTDSTTTATASGDGTVTAYFDIDSFTVDTTIIGLGTWTIAGGLSRPYGTTINYVSVPTSGWTFVRYGGTYSGTSATGSYVITGNHTDSVIFSIKPIISSFAARVQRDVDWDYVRIGDTGTLKFSTDIGDSAEACTTWINRGRTIIAPMIGWFNESGTDSIQIRIPAGVPLNYYYRSKVKNRYGIMNDDPTAHTMHVIGRVN